MRAHATEPSEDYEHPPHRRLRRSGASRKLALALAITLGVAAMACAPSKKGPPRGVWDALAQCEASGDWAANTGNGYYGGLQFKGSTWTSHGGGQFAPTANLASREQQIIVGERVLASQGWGAWPDCSHRLGLR